MIDYLILGGGSAGCVLATRLSENPGVQVSLIEAGRNIAAGNLPDNIRSRYPGRAYLDETNIWADLKAYIGAPKGETAGRSPRRYEQGRVLGGGSAVNAMVANRGAPGDYDEWGAEGATGWSWETALPYFRKLEHDFDFDDDYHGQDGPIPIRRIKPANMSPFVKNVIDTLAARGHQRQADQNGAWKDGIYVGAIAVSDKGERVPTSVAYLSPDVRSRPNLRILTNRFADRLVLDGRRVTGAVVSDARDHLRTETLVANETIISCGAIHSPALLMRSGIGPGEHLKKHGIAVAIDKAGVGQNLMEHPSTAVSTYLPPQSRLRDLNEHHDHAILRFSSGLNGTPKGDMHAAIIARSGWHSVGQRVGTLFIWVNKAYSRGHVQLNSTDAREEPLVDFRMLSDERDLERLKMGFRVGAETLMDSHMDGHRGTVFPTSYSPRVASLAGPGIANQIQRGLFGAMLDHSYALRPWLIHSVVTLGVEMKDLLADDKALTAFVSGAVGGVWHASGTCKMGREGDPLAVTNGSGEVYGIAGLRICDASLMPTIPRANTNTPVIMMAEKIADDIKAKR